MSTITEESVSTSGGTIPLRSNVSQQDQTGIDIAYEQAKKSYDEGGIPIGGCLVDNRTGEVLGRGHNQRIQRGSAILHGEMDTLENAGRLPASTYRNCTLYTSLSACNMCTGAILLYGIKRVVIGENDSFQGPHELLQANGVEVINMKDDRCKQIMQEYIDNNRKDWDEDIGE